MLPSSALNRRIKVLVRILQKNKSNVIYNYVRAYVTKENVSIGATFKEINPVKHPEYVPRNYCKPIKPFTLNTYL